ncbi:MAG: hypothetical protein AABY22_13755, partial [Nanoarchaeota archaeon]
MSKLKIKIGEILKEGISVHPKSNKILYKYDLFDQLLQLFKDTVERAIPNIYDKSLGLGTEEELLVASNAFKL